MVSLGISFCTELNIFLLAWGDDAQYLPTEMKTHEQLSK